MKVKKIKGGVKEREILIGMVTNKTVLAAVSDRWDKDGLFDSRWSNLIAKWCVDYYRKYNKPPRRQMESIFSRWTDSREGRDHETVKLVESFLSTLSREYDQKGKVQVDYLVDLAGEYFTKVKAGKLRDRIDGLLEDGKVKDAVETIRKFDEIELVAKSGWRLGYNDAAVDRAFDSSNLKPLIRYPGAAGNFFADHFQRDALISFIAPEKRGKTWWLIDVAWRAMEQGNRVIFFEVGDMTENQVIRRLGARATGKPYRRGEYRYPKMIAPSADSDLPDVIHRTVRPGKEDIIRSKQAKRAFQRLAYKKDYDFELFTYPNDTATVNDIKTKLRVLTRAGRPPDVVVIDYADLLAHLDPRGDERSQTNKTWKGLRAISQEFHCLVVTAEQAKATAYEKDTLGMEDFSEDKRKNAHVTGKIGINVGDEERLRGVHRLNWLFLREAEYDRRKFLWTTPCLSIGQTCIHSIYTMQRPKSRRNRHPVKFSEN